VEIPIKLREHVQSLTWDFRPPGSLEFLSVGRAATLKTRVALFRWELFLREYGGEAFMQEIRRRLSAAYDYVLIDAPAGAMDRLSICTVHLPDVLVCPFSMVGNNPEELSALLSGVVEQGGGSRLRVFPVPTGVQFAEQELLERLRVNTQRTLAWVLTSEPGNKRAEYFASVEVPYRVFYAYQKIPSALADRAGFPFFCVERNGAHHSVHYERRCTTSPRVSGSGSGTCTIRLSASFRVRIGGCV